MPLRPPGIWFLEGRKMARWDVASRATVSYTHLTLPTTHVVLIPGEDVY